MARQLVSNRSLRTLFIAGSVICSLSFGLRATFALSFAPMALDVHWTRSTFALALGLQNILWGISQPFVGALADRYGTAKVLAAGGICYVIGLAIVPLSTQPGTFDLGIGAFIGLAISASSFALVLGAIGKVVAPEKRSMALGIVSAGGSLGQLALPPVAAVILGGGGWHLMYVVFAVLACLIVPFAAAFRIIPRNTTATDGSQTLREAVREATSQPSFWLTNAGFFVCGFHVAFLSTHLPYIVSGAKLPTIVAGAALAMIGGFNIGASFLFGYLGDRVPKHYLLSIIYGLRAAAMLAFILVPTTALSVYFFAAAMGALWLSTVPLTSALITSIFGPRWSSMLFGFAFFTHQVGSFFGAWLGGYLFDRTGSYAIMWAIAIGLAVFAALANLPIAERPVTRRTPVAAAAFFTD